jgi:replicative superfamily II helicase
LEKNLWRLSLAHPRKSNRQTQRSWRANVIIFAPTSSGKTLVGEIVSVHYFMAKRALLSRSNEGVGRREVPSF